VPQGEDVDRRFHFLDQVSNLAGVHEARRVEDVRARVAIGAQPTDRVLKIVDAIQVVLGARSEDDPVGARSCCGGGDAIDRYVERIDAAASRVVILDRATRGTGLRDQLHSGGDAGRVIGEATLGVNVERYINCLRQLRDVDEQLVARDVLVGSPERRGVAGAGGRQGLEPHRREQPRGAHIPRVGHNEQTVTVQLSEALATIRPRRGRHRFPACHLE